jgi:hypothetical protein
MTKSSGNSARSDHGLPERQRDLRAEGRRVPKDWSMTATNIVASKYLHGTVGTPSARPACASSYPRRRNHSRLGQCSGILPHPRRRRHFPRRTRSSLVRQYGLQLARLVQRGLRPHRAHVRRHQLALEFTTSGKSNSASPATLSPQCSACFINSVKDSLDSILTLAKTEGMLFKWGSAPARILSPLRSSTEAAQRRRHRQRSAQLHERLRRLRRRHQVRRQDAPRRQDGHPECRPSRHRRLHRLQE